METRSGTDRAAYDPASSAQPPATEKATVVEDFIDIFYTPSTVFARREKSGAWAHFLIITVLSVLFAFASRSVISQIFDAEFSRGMAKAMASNPRLTPDMVNSMRPIQEKIGTAFIYAAAPLTILFTAIFVWIAAKIFSAKVTFGQSAAITTLAYIPRLVAGLLGVMQVVLLDTANYTNRYSLTLTPARFLDPDTTNPKLFALLGSIDPFAIWFTILIGIGLAIVGKVPRSKGYMAAATVFVVLTLVGVLFAR